MTVSLVAAVAGNGVIGAANDMPWRLPSDLKRFKAITMGKPVVMGRKTWESIGRPLPGRTNIVVSRDKDFRPAGAHAAASLEEALELARSKAGGDGEICVIGGGQIYEQAMALADRLYITHVLAEPDGDIRFPPIDPRQWTVAEEAEVVQADGDSAATRFRVYRRADQPSATSAATARQKRTMAADLR